MSSKNFHPIVVSEIDKSAEDSVIIRLDIPQELQDEYAFTQGQYLTMETEINGELTRRSYSLCSSPIDNQWKVGIKKIDNGKFSTFANDILQVGDRIDVMPPNGHFFIDIEPHSDRQYVAFAAGSGITPLLSIISTHLRQEPNSRFKLFYVNRTVGSIMLKEELEALKNQFMDRFEIYYFLTKQKRNIPFLNGRMDLEKLNVIFDSICPLDSIDHFFSCGPEPMTLMIRDYLLEHNVDKSRIHFELFTTEGSYNERSQEIKERFKGQSSDITILEGGKSFNFIMEKGSNNILDEALNNNADLPFACKGGVCATCKAKLIEGEVDMPVHYGLEDDELENDYVLTCQTIPLSDKIIVDYDI